MQIEGATVVKEADDSNDDDEAEEGQQSGVEGEAMPPMEHGKLHDIDFQARKGDLIIIVGSIGSGKSSVLNAILGELKRQTGSVVLRGSVAVCSQNPWITTGTVRQNILFGVSHDEEKYQGVIEACALKRDFELLAHGDKTDIGE